MIGTTAAILGSALVGAGSSALASSKASKAAKNATAAQTASNDAALGLQRDQYNQTRADYEPWRQTGVAALQKLNNTFQLNVPIGAWSGQTATPIGSGSAAGQGTAATAQPVGTGVGGKMVSAISPMLAAQMGQGDTLAGNATVGTPTAQPETAGVVPQPTGGQFGDFFESPGYRFRVSEGERAVTGNMAARGLMDSGALGKGLIDYGQQAGSQEFGSWVGQMFQLAGLGQQANNANAVAGAASTNAQAGIMQNQGANLASGYATRGGIGAGIINQAGSVGAGLIKNWPTAPAGYNTGLPQSTAADPGGWSEPQLW